MKLCWFVFICRIISEFEAFRNRALTKPEDTREMIDMLKFVEEAKTKDLVKLNSDIKVNTMCMCVKSTMINTVEPNADLIPV